MYICFHAECSSIWWSSKADREYYTSMLLLDAAQSRPSLDGRTEQLRVAELLMDALKNNGPRVTTWNDGRVTKREINLVSRCLFSIR
jgi:hypothetical protein